MNLLVLIPAYNEAPNIVRTVTSLQENCPGMDFIVINDGSSDATARLCRQEGYPLLDLPVNLGLADAFQTGIRYAWQKGFDAALQFDGDGQHEASCIPLLMTAAEETGADVVIGSRFLTQKKPFSARMFGSRMLTEAIRLTTGQKLTDPTSGMRLYNRKVIERIADNINYGPEPDTLAYLIRSGVKVSEAQVEMHERMAGTSYLTLGRSMSYMLNMVVSIFVLQFFRKRGD